MTTRDLVNHILLTGQKGYKDMEDGNRISDKMTLLVKEHIKAEAEKMVSERLREDTYMTCDVCGCHPSVIITTSFGKFCQQHAKYI